MLMMPPLLADLIRHVLTRRVGPVAAIELAEMRDSGERLRVFAPDAVILGPAARPADAAPIRNLLPKAQILLVSHDLARLVDLDTGEDGAFAPDALADRLLR